jgi:hypothetical protein
MWKILRDRPTKGDPNEKEAEFFTKQILKEILPTTDVPDPILTVIGSLSILYNRINFNKLFNVYILSAFFPIKTEDKYFNKRVLEQLLEVLKLPSERVTDENKFAWLTSIIKLSFKQLMVKYLESHHYPVSTAKITME